MTLKHTAIALAIGLTGQLAIHPNSANAQTAALEEVIVTAQKRDQSLQDVPIAVSALSSDYIQQTGAVSLSDISKNSPGLRISDTQSESISISLRGIGSNDFGYSSDESIPVYLDGVYMGEGAAIIGDLMDIAQIEILKGPQGTLFGRNAVGGAVNVTSSRPTDEPEAALHSGFGNYDLRTVKGMLNLPLLEDTLVLRINASKRDRDGWQRNVTTGKRDGFEQDRWNSRAKLLWTPSDNLEVELSSDWQRQQDHSGYSNLIFTLFPSALFAPESLDITSKAAAAGDAYFDLEGNLDGPEGEPVDHRLHRKIRGNALKVVWDLSDELTLTSISSYREIKSRIAEDSDGSEYQVFNVRSFLDNEEYSQELRLNGSSEKLDWFVGLSAYREDVDGSVIDSFGAIVGGPFTEHSRVTAKTESYALFGDAIWRLNDSSNITFGARYSYDAKSQDIKNTDIGFIFPSPEQFIGANGQVNTALASSHQSWNDLSLRLVADHRLDENTMVFAGISQGYKSGGFNSFPTVDLSGSTLIPGTAIPAVPFGSTAPFDEEKIINYEAGIKSTLLDQRLRLNASVFYYDFTDLQFLINDAVSVIARNAGKANGKGIDLESSYLLNDALTISANLSWLDAEYGEDVRNTDGSLIVRKGQELAESPGFSGTISLDYRLALASAGDLRAHLNYSYIGERTHSSESLSDIYREKAYGLLSARLSFTSSNQKWEVAAWGKNLNDKTFIECFCGLSDEFGFIPARRGEPRSYGLEVNYYH
ncbi:TonB-dependent receptor [Pseudoteredinibacter isoporae]|uniref:Iron complex outermembrane receptor protein n=1 Tax=Pseudoteredinibacter isoporae TaxID=570281 RepID=A0A7X0MV56_9GAMM|nr:TonB-dependent receptor [Pseudoteredinibacter isoporae]MBB6521371.1 iron complex outermembrane receptor protein [Pseudoteredinibacter isoporae]NHO86926.1 TonB-dependent receptor [Pseudoteredinibacter isoporae]NIB24621.1 TonB-dependent receptor [Pseudoteredinibacter isoporae]